MLECVRKWKNRTNPVQLDVLPQYFWHWHSSTEPDTMQYCAVYIYILYTAVPGSGANLYCCSQIVGSSVNAAEVRAQTHHKARASSASAPRSSCCAAELTVSGSSWSNQSKEKKSLTSFLFVELYLQAVCRAAVVQTRGRLHKWVEKNSPSPFRGSAAGLGETKIKQLGFC